MLYVVVVLLWGCVAVCCRLKVVRCFVFVFVVFGVFYVLVVVYCWWFVVLVYAVCGSLLFGVCWSLCVVVCCSLIVVVIWYSLWFVE